MWESRVRVLGFHVEAVANKLKSAKDIAWEHNHLQYRVITWGYYPQYIENQAGNDGTQNGTGIL